MNKTSAVQTLMKPNKKNSWLNRNLKIMYSKPWIVDTRIRLKILLSKILTNKMKNSKWKWFIIKKKIKPRTSEIRSRRLKESIRKNNQAWQMLKFSCNPREDSINTPMKMVPFYYLLMKKTQSNSKKFLSNIESIMKLSFIVFENFIKYEV